MNHFARNTEEVRYSLFRIDYYQRELVPGRELMQSLWVGWLISSTALTFLESSSMANRVSAVLARRIFILSSPKVWCKRSVSPFKRGSMPLNFFSSFNAQRTLLIGCLPIVTTPFASSIIWLRPLGNFLDFCWTSIELNIDWIQMHPNLSQHCHGDRCVDFHTFVKKIPDGSKTSFIAPI
jgi:hypothetical protein